MFSTCKVKWRLLTPCPLRTLTVREGLREIDCPSSSNAKQSRLLFLPHSHRILIISLWIWRKEPKDLDSASVEEENTKWICTC